MRPTKLLTLTAILLSIAMIFPAAAFSGDIENSRLLPENKVAVYQDGEKIADYSEEMPVPEGKLLAPTGGKCAVRLGKVSFIAEDQSRFALESDEDYRYLSVTQGTVYFGLTKKSRSMVFLTPKGAVSSEQVMLNASSDNQMLEGYVKVTEESSEVGVLKGGSMILASREGQQKLDSGQSMLLAQAEGGEEAGAQAGESAGWWANLSTVQKVGIATVGVIGVGGAAYAISEAGDDDDDEASPASP